MRREREGEGDEEIAVRDRRKKSQGGAGVPKIGAGEEKRAKETIRDAEVKPEVVAKAKLPKLPPFQDGKDNLNSYLQRFEQFARTSGWAEDQ